MSIDQYFKADNDYQDEDLMKIDKLQLINASARYQLLSANKQLIDFHLGRIMNKKRKNKKPDPPKRLNSSYVSTTLREKEQNTLLS